MFNILTFITGDMVASSCFCLQQKCLAVLLVLHYMDVTETVLKVNVS